MIQLSFQDIATRTQEIPSSITDETSNGHWEMDLKSNKLTWDNFQYGIYGYKPSETNINNEFFIAKTTYSSDIKRVSKIIDEALRHEEFYTFKRRIVKKNGVLGYAETYANIIRCKSGIPISIIGTTKDIGGLTVDGVYDFNDPHFFNLMFADYKQAVLAEIHKVVRDRDIEKDLCQDIFLKAWNHMGQYNAVKGGLYTWLINITKNHCKDYFRSKFFQNHKVTSSFDYEVHDKAEEISNMTPITEFLIHLTPEQRELIELLFVRGYTQTEVSKIKNSPLGTIKTKSRNAIMVLRKFAFADANSQSDKMAMPSTL